MPLSPEERKQIYEEEKARIEAQQKAEAEKARSGGDTVQGLGSNVAALLCYIGGWISGIILLVLEEKNQFVRFHAAQSIVVFGSLNLLAILLGWIPRLGGMFSGLIAAVAFVFWIVLMVKAYQGERYRVPLAADIAENMVWKSGAGAASAGSLSRQAEHFPESRAGRITGSAIAIVMSVALLIFFNFFHQYVAYYNGSTVDGVTEWTRYPLFTSDIQLWLPVLTLTLMMTIAIHILLIIYDRYVLRESAGIFLDGLGLATVVTLLAVFPFDFSVIPDATAADITRTAVGVVLILIAFGLAVSIVSKLVKLLVRLATGKAHY
jgi:uncharacterized membrane protein